MLRFERDDGRWYKAHIEQDLLGQVYVVRVNGGRVRKKGRIRRDPCATREDAVKLLAEIVRARLGNNYRLLPFRGLD